jgi:hypothetical protein
VPLRSCGGCGSDDCGSWTRFEVNGGKAVFILSFEPFELSLLRAGASFVSVMSGEFVWVRGWLGDCMMRCAMGESVPTGDGDGCLGSDDLQGLRNASRLSCSTICRDLEMIS